MKVVNLLPKEVMMETTIITRVKYPRSGRVARVREKTEGAEEIILRKDRHGFPLEIRVSKKTFGEVYIEDTSSKEHHPFPAPRKGVIYIVPEIVAAHLPGRKDVFFLGEIFLEIGDVMVCARRLISF